MASFVTTTTLRSIRPRLQFAALTHELPALVEGLKSIGVGTIIDFAREHRPAKESARVAEVIATRMHEFPSAMHAVKLSALGIEENHETAAAHMRNIAARAATLGTSVCVDAEENALHGNYSKTAFDLMRDYNTGARAASGYPTVFKTYQMYRADAVDELTRDIEIAKSTGFALGAKLVRGAYLRVDRNSGALLPDKAAVDKSFEKGLGITLEDANDHVTTLVATRNIANIEQALEHENGDRCVYAQLLGMDDETTNRLLQEAPGSVLKYVPFGSIVELSPYLYRRLLERMSWS
jgi:proline dehydrogenase